MTLRINLNETVLGSNPDGSIYMKISSEANNGLSIQNNQIVATKGKDGTTTFSGTFNTPGNGVSGKANQNVAILRFNSSVSRKKRTTGIDEGVIIDNTFINHIING